jgi:hypothetical protein
MISRHLIIYFRSSKMCWNIRKKLILGWKDIFKIEIDKSDII